MSPRTYQLGQRQDAVDLNRARIIEAARDLLSAEEGVSRFTIDAVARRADVARMTVYYQFGSRVGLLEALCDWLAAEGGIEQLRDAFMAAPEASLTRLIDVFCAFWASNRLVLRRLFGMAAIDPEFSRVLEARQQRRRHAIEAVLRRLHGDDFPEHTALRADLLVMLTSFQTYENLATDRRTPSEVSALIGQMARAALQIA
jgi:AcrR family transcriptional regulator